ncbi:MAG: HtaA domain-containing protein [Solirubrobacterales bacterium]
MTHRTRKLKLVFALCLTACSVMFAAQSAQAEITPITEGSVDWGVRQSFREYLTSDFVNGTITVSEGAKLCGKGVCDTDGVSSGDAAGAQCSAASYPGPPFNVSGGCVGDHFNFPVVSGGFDQDTHTLELQLGGKVNFTGHDGALDTTLSNFRVELRDGVSVLRVDSHSIERDTAEESNLTDVALVRLDLTGVTPVIDGGVTTWSNLPAKMTAQGVPVFSSYPAGDAMDPVSISYTGPGGAPLPEPFDDPGTAKFSEVGEHDLGGGPIKIFHDRTHHIVHVLEATTLTAYDADTFEQLDQVTLPDDGSFFWQFGNGFDPEHSTVFAALDPSSIEDPESNDLRAYSFNTSTHDYTEQSTGLSARRNVAYSTSADRLYSIAGGNIGTNITPTVAAADFDGDTDTWVPRGAYSDIAGGNSSIVSVQATSDGKLFGAYSPVINLSSTPMTVTRKPLYSFADTGSALVATAIPGTQLSPATVNFGAGVSSGYIVLAADDEGSFAAAEYNMTGASRQLLTIDPAANASGFNPATATSLDFQPGEMSYDANGDLYIGHGDAIDVFRDGESFNTIDVGDALRGIGGGEGHVYAMHGDDVPYKVTSWALGYTATITKQPTSQSITVGSRHDSQEVTFESAASGIPEPTVRWQRRGASESTWSDIAGATGGDLDYPATAADDDASFRAIYTNRAGSVATTTVKLSVAVDDVDPPVVTITSPVNGSSTTAESATLSFTVSDNDTDAPVCTEVSGATKSLKLGANTFVVICQDDSGNQASASVVVTRTAPVTPTPPVGEVPAPAAPQVKNGKTVTLKQGKSATVTNGTVTCASTTTCVYTFPKSVKIKVGKKSYSVKVKGPSTLEPGKSGAIKVTLTKSIVTAIKKSRKTVKITVPVQVSNTNKVRHETAKNSISNVR